jgi:hypothetical protein
VISTQYKLRLLSDQRTSALSFPDSTSVHLPQWWPPRSVRLWLCEGSNFPSVVCQSYSELHTHTFYSSFSHVSKCTSACSFISLSIRLISLSILIYPQVTSCVQNSSKTMQKVSKFNFLQPQRLDSMSQSP